MIVELLEAHDAAAFPRDCRGVHVAGVNLVILNADIVGLASACLASAGSLPDTQRLILEGCLADTERVVPLLSGEARVYFASLREIATAVLNASDGKPAD